MVTAFYFITFIASMAMIGSFLYRNRRIDTGYALFAILIALNSLGRWLVAASVTVEQAVWANKIMYIGACYIPLMLLWLIGKLSNYKLPRPLMAFLFIYSTVVYLLVLTIGWNGLYYRSTVLAEGNGYHYLVKDYGPTHALFPAMMILYIVLLALLLIRAFVNRRKIAFSYTLALGGLGVSVIAMYLLTRLLHSSIEWLSLGYLIAVIIVTRIFERINMYDMTTNIASSVEQMRENGYIVFDNQRRFVSANEYMKILFPEIEGWVMDQALTDTDTPLCRDLLPWAFDHPPGDRRGVEVDGKYMEAQVRDVVYGKRDKIVGCMLTLTDRSAEHEYLSMVETYNEKLAADVAAKTDHINHIKDQMVLGIAAMVESRDNSTGGHIRRTSQVVSIFARRLLLDGSVPGLSAGFLGMVERAAPMHDLGKIAVDDQVLRKNGKFTDEEYAKMKCHAAEGARIVRSIMAGVEDEVFVAIAENVAHYHHEKWDGRGYPDGISGEEIPVEARIMALADVFDALVSKRCYKEAFDYDRAFSIIDESTGSHFDPVLGRIFLKCRPELEAMYDAAEAIPDAS